MKPRLSLDAQLALLLVAVAGGAAALGVYAAERLEDGAWLLAVAIAVPVALLLSRLPMRPVNALLRALTDGMRSLHESDFSLSIAEERADELGELVRLYNRLGDVLRRERQNLYQRELLLDTVIQSTPLALLLCDDGQRVVYGNAAARALLGRRDRLEGLRLEQALEQAPAPLRDAALSGSDGLIGVQGADEMEQYQLSRSDFTLNGRSHTLLLAHRLTRELTRQELATWKKVIRVLGHELNNSLAPISSLAHSARKLVSGGDARIDGALATIEERAARLKHFLEEYARFARLPEPRRETVDWPAFVERLRASVAFRLDGALPASPGRFDSGQLQQALINLLKNAHEAGGPASEVALEVTAEGAGVRIRVLDRGPGMSEEVLQHALLPFYTTKDSGTGLGLALCRDIAEAHHGRISLALRDGGGLEVRMWLPS